jgi:glycyl-tRNA synthetase alpha chain
MQNVESVFEIVYTSDGKKYGEFFKENERDFSSFALDQSDPLILKRHLADFISESKRFAELKNFRVSYDFAIKGSHILNLLDARGEVNLNQKTEYLFVLKNLIKEIASIIKN